MTESTIVEGVGDEVLAVFVFLTVLTIYVVNQLLRAYQQRPAVIHPDAAERVRQAQRLLGRVRPPERVHGNREECSICLDALALPVVTNCGHEFCSGCFKALLDIDPGIQLCPVCRSRVTVLFGNLHAAPNDVQHVVHAYNVRHSGVPRSVWEQLADLPTVLYESARRLGFRDVVRAIARVKILCYMAFALAFLLSPLDLIPDVVPIIGLVDDLVLLLFVTVLVGRALVAVVVDLGHPVHNRAAPPPAVPPGGANAQGAPLID